MTSLTEALEGLLEQHRALGSPVGDYLRPGSDPDAIERAISSLGLHAPGELVELYAWADGTDEAAWQRTAGPAPFLRFLGDARFPPLAAAVEWCLEVRGLAIEVAESSDDALEAEALWHPSWFPAFRLDGGEYAIACSPDQPPAVRSVRWDGAIPVQSFPSLTALIEAATKALRDDYVWLPDDRVLLQREVAALRPSD